MTLQSVMQRAITVVDWAEARVVSSDYGTGNRAWQWKPLRLREVGTYVSPWSGTQSWTKLKQPPYLSDYYFSPSSCIHYNIRQINLPF